MLRCHGVFSPQWKRPACACPSVRWLETARVCPRVCACGYACKRGKRGKMDPPGVHFSTEDGLRVGVSRHHGDRVGTATHPLNGAHVHVTIEGADTRGAMAGGLIPSPGRPG